MNVRTISVSERFSPGTTESSTDKTVHHDIAEILLNVVLNTIAPRPLSVKLLTRWIQIENKVEICHRIIFIGVHSAM